jgi:hypothetical protein
VRIVITSLNIYIYEVKTFATKIDEEGGEGSEICFGIFFLSVKGDNAATITTETLYISECVMCTQYVVR